MSDKYKSPIINQFFKALGESNFDQCEILLSQIALQAATDQECDSWLQYFKGVLLKERHLALDKAAQVFLQLLERDSLKPFLRGQVLLSLGNMFHLQGEWNKAIYVSRQALSIFVDLEQLEEQAKVWIQIAFAYYKGFVQGDYGTDVLEEAVSYCESSLTALNEREKSDNNLTLQAHTWNTLGLIYGCLKRWDEATGCFLKVLEISTLQGNEFFSGFAYTNLGEVYQRIGKNRWQDALDAYQKAVDIFFKYDDEYQAVEVAANIGFLYSKMGQQSEAIDYYAMAIGLIDLLRSGISTEAARTGFFATVTDTYANIILTCVAANKYAQAFEYMEQACSRTFLDLLDAGSLELKREIHAETITLAEVQAALPDDVILLEYFTTGLVEAREHRSFDSRSALVKQQRDFNRHRFPPQKTLLFAITHTDIQVFDVAVSPNDLYPNRRDAVVEEYFLEPRIRRALYKFLLSPAEECLVGKKRIYLVPHGPLHYVPFQALIASDGEPLLRENGPQLIYSPSATVLLRAVIRGGPQNRVTETTQNRERIPCLAIGYNGGAENPLLYAEAEAQQIARIMQGVALTGDQVQKSEVLEEAAHCNWLHFSCHGTFEPDNPLASALYLNKKEKLTAQEILEKLTLQCDLVSLSACESGLSQVRRGDELFGLARAFIGAGARTLVVTQWKVEELSTRIVMERLCRNLLSGMDNAEALTEAQLYLRTLTRDGLFRLLAKMREQNPPTMNIEQTPATVKGKSRRDQRVWDSAFVKSLSRAQPNDLIFSDPYYWAPFILIGNRNRVIQDDPAKRTSNIDT